MKRALPGLQFVALLLISCLLIPIAMDAWERRGGRQAKTEVMSQLLTAGQTALGDARFEVARVSFRQALGLDPFSGDARAGLVLSEAHLIVARTLKMKRSEAYRFIERFEHVAKSGIKSRVLQVALAQLYHATGDTKRASETFELALKDVKDMPQGEYAYGVFLRERGDEKSARRAFERALDSRADFLDASLALGRLYRKADRPEEARKVYEAQVTHSEDAAELRFELGDVLLALKAHEESYRHLKAALKLPTDKALKIRILGRVGIAAFLTKRGFEAVGYFEQMPTSALTPSMRSNLALAYQNLGHHRKAVALLQPLHAKAPLDAGVVVQLMTALMKSNKSGEARRIGTDFLMSAKRIKSLAASAESVRSVMAQIPMRPQKPVSVPTQSGATQ